jgi:hypothetical protein
MRVKPMSMLGINELALVENLAGDVHNPRKRSHLGRADRREIIKVLHFLYHYDTKKHKHYIVCSNQKVKGLGKKHISVVRPV